MTSPAPGGRRERPALPRAGVVALRVDGLSADGDATRDSATVTDVGFGVEAGSVVLLTPAGAGRTVVLCLTGELPRRSGRVESGSGAARREVDDTAWRAVLGRVPGPPETPADTPVGTVLDERGEAARRMAARLGVTVDAGTHVGDLDPADGILLGVAVALADDPDVVAVDLRGPTRVVAHAATVLDAVRDVVDVDGRTVLVVADAGALDAAALRLVDEVVELVPADGP
ncbi:hypothetical protein KC207_04315 [Phycicoccus sp. BSK3Z-2]|uniref:Uncharacterized protein n=1 Tax=Phycicoccus avicenniae TaxID=2828860 RepID=A0A941D6S7_9MICO|nr:hypothetical protein [Phycicoccus avicenniae]MBR7742511.1 hypothetical protein [Phycicoccus avicenniae]